jgi:catechol 2,3-dioxygenase-like lactoylglutathione lyase family enzyme
MVQSFGLTHISLATQDLERSALFYQEVFGMLIIERHEKSLVLQTPNTKDLLALELRPQPYPKGGVLHFGFRLKTPEDIDEAIALAVKAGGALLKRGEFAPGCPFAYLADPEGYKIEIWYQPW